MRDWRLRISRSPPCQMAGRYVAHKSDVIRKSLISIDYRNYETLNYSTGS
jgi:hypothetical protein